MDAIRKLKVGWLIAGVVVVGLVAIVELGRLSDQRAIANQKTTGLGASPARSTSNYLNFYKDRKPEAGGIVGGVPGGAAGGVVGGLISSQPAYDKLARHSSELVPSANAATLDKKILRDARLEMLVKDVRETVTSLQRTTESFGGSVEQADIREEGTSRAGEMTVRVPAEKLDAALDAFRKLGVRVRSEHQASKDVTREFVDTEARLRNMRAEEDQYLSLLKRAGSMKDTLAVTAKLSEIRGEIESTQGELKWMERQAAMSAVSISMSEESHAPAVAQWRPLYNARIAGKEMLEGLADWADWLVALLVKLPLILAWLATLAFFAGIVWKIGRAAWRRFKPTRNAGLAPVANQA
jgi:hypothetical protein